MANELILIVDDVPENLKLLVQILRGDYRISAASHARQALDIIASGELPDLILLDVMMPEMDGYELCSKLKADSKTHDIPVIFITAKTQEEDETRGFEMGAVDYITKPISMPVVKSRVRTHLELKTKRQRLEERTRELNTALGALELRNRVIRQIFGRYLSDDVVDTILETPEGLELGGEKREITLMMTDLRGFTGISERMPAEDVVWVINIYLEIMTDIILRYQGSINEFIGDAILVLFGAPIAREDHALRAVSCALEMQAAMELVNQRAREQGFPEVHQGIGINTGEVVVGNIGSSKRAKYGVVGRHVNLTARIESYTLGGQTFISERTRDACGSILRIDNRMEILPKGIKDPVSIYEVSGIGGGFNIYLPIKEETKPVRLKKPVTIRFRVLSDTQLNKHLHQGVMTALKEMTAFIETRGELELLGNLQLALFDSGGKEMVGDLYAKVTERMPGDAHIYTIHFTSVPPESLAVLIQLQPEH